MVAGGGAQRHPRSSVPCSRTLKGCQKSVLDGRSGIPCGMREPRPAHRGCRRAGRSSTPGYLLASLAGWPGRACISPPLPPKTAGNPATGEARGFRNASGSLARTPKRPRSRRAGLRTRSGLSTPAPSQSTQRSRLRLPRRLGRAARRTRFPLRTSGLSVSIRVHLWFHRFVQDQSIRTAALTISSTRRSPSSPPRLPSWKGVPGIGFQSSRDWSGSG